MGKLSEASFSDDLRSLMNAYDKLRAKWIAKFGYDAGFDQWFSERLRVNTTLGTHEAPPPRQGQGKDGENDARPAMQIIGNAQSVRR